MIDFNRKDYSDVIDTYADDPMGYCLNVLEGRIVAGELIRYACLRHLRDLQRIENDPEFPYVYSVKRAQGMVNLASFINMVLLIILKLLVIFFSRLITRNLEIGVYLLIYLLKKHYVII